MIVLTSWKAQAELTEKALPKTSQLLDTIGNTYLRAKQYLEEKERARQGSPGDEEPVNFLTKEV